MGSPLIQFLGTGNAFSTDGRGAQSILFAPGSASPFLVDLGPTSVHAMVRFDVDWRKIDRLFLTHLHGDHTAGWPFLLLHQVFVAGRRKSFHVHAPKGAAELLESLTSLCYGELLEKREFDLLYHEFKVEEQTGLGGPDGMTFDLLPMQHHESSVGIRFRM